MQQQEQVAELAIGDDGWIQPAHPFTRAVRGMPLEQISSAWS